MSIKVTSNIDVKEDEVLLALDSVARAELAGKTKHVYVFNNNRRHETFIFWKLDEKLGTNAKDGLEKEIVKAWEEVHGTTPRVYVSDSFKL